MIGEQTWLNWFERCLVSPDWGAQDAPEDIGHVWFEMTDIRQSSPPLPGLKINPAQNRKSIQGGSKFRLLINPDPFPNNQGGPMAKRILTVLDDGETWSGAGSVLLVPEVIMTQHEGTDDMSDRLAVEMTDGSHRPVTELTGVQSLDVRALVKYYLHQKNRGIPRNPKTRRLLMAVEKP
jgi:hypothetical protein